jgi:peptidoglycan L-alanyl-D-glutamate endopeptidase CwlK
MDAMTPRDRARLVGVHPALIEAVADILAELDAWGSPMFVVEGRRTVDRQAQLYAQGRTIAGPIVTYKDGQVHRSNHQAHADGFGHAVDCAFVDGDPFARTHPWQRFGDAVEARGLVWGGRWKMADLPHIELMDTDAKKA